jgi:hypothetical protein
MSTAAGMEKSISIDRDLKLQPIRFGLELPVFVIFTSINRTLHALEKASQLAEPLRSGIEILVVQTVPFALPLEDPSVPFEFLVKQLKEKAAQFPVQIKISAYLCRDQLHALKQILHRNCTVVMGIRKRWWPTRDERVARKLRRGGLDVILVEME